jgi:copper chaperone NosL
MQAWNFRDLGDGLEWEGEVPGPDRLRFMGMTSRYVALISDYSRWRGESGCGYGRLMDRPPLHRRRRDPGARPDAAAAAAPPAAARASGPKGMAEIKWDRDTCVRCSMVISDRRFAAEMRGGEKDIVFKFDDIGCAVFWLRDKAADFPWMAEAGHADLGRRCRGQGRQMAGCAQGTLLRRAMSPMGYNFSARAYAEAGSAKPFRRNAPARAGERQIVD